MAELTPRQFAIGRRFRADVRRTTAGARERWSGMEDHATADVWLSVATEEFGKLARCVNKLHIAEAPEVRKQWTEEGWHRLVTIASVLERLAVEWESVAAATGDLQ